MLYHGDRAITACDGGWTVMPGGSPIPGTRPHCDCPGWARR